MKRKLDENDEPVAGEPSAGEPSDGSKHDEATFADLGLDPRLLQAIAEQGFHTPTLVQQKAIPPILDGQSVLAKARTGSGKTAAYLLPVLQAILRRKASDSSAFTSTLILVPTRELASQVHKAIEALSSFCAKDVSAVKLSDKLSADVQRAQLANSPDIVVATPARAWSNVDGGALALDRLTHLVLDEADLVLSYGYKDDLQNVSRALPKGAQAILMSATLTGEVDTLRGIFCRDPVLLDLVEKEAECTSLSQYYVKCAEDEKFLLVYVIYKLKLVKGKSIIFVADIDRCYRLKLFFEQFGLRSCVLNSELPVNSRIHVVEEFNRHVYDVIIASDEHEVLGDEAAEETAQDENETNTEGEEGSRDADTGKNRRPEKPGTERPKKKRKVAKRDNEYGVSRGIDFKNVACVVNFDLPMSAKSYTHRIGRTARAGQTGMALSFVVPRESYRKHMPTTVETAEHDDRILARIVRQQAARGRELQPYRFDTAQVDAFRYRMNDALRAVTRAAVREARARELRQELLKSEKLRRHFEENPAELRHLRHDGELRAARTQAHLRHVPEYLLPGGGQQHKPGSGFLPLRDGGREDRRRGRDGKGKGKARGGQGRPFAGKGRRTDPLKSFKARQKK